MRIAWLEMLAAAFMLAGVVVAVLLAIAMAIWGMGTP
jgi:hypothetical protein